MLSHHAPHHPRPRAVAAAFLALALAVSLAACGSSSKKTQAAYCDAWSGVATAFKQVDKVNVVQDGLGSIKTYLDGLKTSLDTLGKAAGDQLGAEVTKVKDSAGKLADTVTSPDLPVDRRQQVRDAKDQLTTAWNGLLTKAKADCPNVKA